MPIYNRASLLEVAFLSVREPERWISMLVNMDCPTPNVYRAHLLCAHKWMNMSPVRPTDMLSFDEPPTDRLTCQLCDSADGINYDSNIYRGPIL
jgi:hypothetical protein